MAMLWEENPKTHDYESQYLNRLISPNSGWQLEDAYDINDDGIIACDGWYQAYDSNGNPLGDRQWRACLLVPAYEIQVDAFIPQEYVPWPFNTPFLSYFYAGDMRKDPLDGVFNSGIPIFQKGAGYRLRQRVAVTILPGYDDDGSQEKEQSNNRRSSIVGLTKQYPASAIVGGSPGTPDAHLSPTAVPDNTGLATPTIASVTVTHPTHRVVTAEIKCEASNPLVSSSSRAPIYYGITITVDASNPTQPRYTLSGDHKLFPAYEVYINKQLVHDYSPIPGHYDEWELADLSYPLTDPAVTAGTTLPLTGNINP